MTAEKQGRISVRIDAQADAAPFEYVPFAGDQVLDHAHAAAVVGRADLLRAEMQPELLRAAGERNGDRDGVIVIDATP